jgi:flagellar hook-associated protein FlgK
METIMATLQQVRDAVAAEGQEVANRLNELATEIQSLKDQIANGNPVTEADLDTLLTDVQNIFTHPGGSGPA